MTAKKQAPKKSLPEILLDCCKFESQLIAALMMVGHGCDETAEIVSIVQATQRKNCEGCGSCR